jgi:hypothetical protein
MAFDPMHPDLKEEWQPSHLVALNGSTGNVGCRDILASARRAREAGIFALDKGCGFASTPIPLQEVKSLDSLCMKQ